MRHAHGPLLQPNAADITQLSATAAHVVHGVVGQFTAGLVYIPYIGQDGVVEEDCVLRDDSHASSKGLLGDISQVLPIHADAAGCGVIEAEQQPQAGRLA